jgi:TonB family protein
MKREKKKESFIGKPIYPGGISAMRSFITANLQYPQEAITSKIEGIVYCKYTINHLGKVIDVKVLSGLGYGCDEEAQRLVGQFVFEIPKVPRRIKVKFFKTIRIKFKLPEKKKIKQPNRTTFQVTYTGEPDKKETYSYSITI